MIGDKIIVREYNRKGAKLVMDHIVQSAIEPPFSVTVSGESGSGKSEVAECLKELLEAQGMSVLILAQDDYFRLPPHSNHQQRKADIHWVGSTEVDLAFMNYHVRKLSAGKPCSIIKPLVYFEENLVLTETVEGPYDVVIAEGTYTAMLKDATIHAFINRNYHETRADRLARNRDQALDNGEDAALSFLETVLEIEHRIIETHIELADIIIPPPEELLDIPEVHS